MKEIVFAAVLVFSCASGSLAQSPPPLASPSASEPIFKERAFGPKPPPTQAPVRPVTSADDDKPIPVGWYIAAGALASLATLLLLYGAARAWRSSNLFDQQYRFPQSTDAAVRFGAPKSGGHLASRQFGDSASVAKSVGKSESEDA